MREPRVACQDTTSQLGTRVVRNEAGRWANAQGTVTTAERCDVLLAQQQ